MSCQQVPTTPAFNPYPRSVQVGEFEVAIGGGIWVAIRGVDGCGLRSPACQAPNLHHYSTGQMSMKGSCNKRRLLCFE